MFDLLRYVDFYAKGLPPVAGGTLDQAEAFLALADAVWADERQWRAAAHGPAGPAEGFSPWR